MRLFLINIILALIWAALTTDFTARNIAWGLILSFIVLAITSSIWETNERSYTSRTWLIIKFIFYIIGDTIVSNIKIACDVITPNPRFKPGVISVPLDVKSDLEITLVANILSFTPGTLSLDVSSDRTKLFFHTMYTQNIEEQRDIIKRHIEQRILGILE